jgi:UDP-N-acetylglucosamine 4,6-dehydratase (inverting)
MLDNKVILITGGTGSFGKRFITRILRRWRPRKLIVYSRDELKQHEMLKLYPDDKFPQLRFFLGDVRDRDRLSRALSGVDVVIHAAALKHVPAAEYNPFEFVKTNIIGAQNLIEACLDKGVKKVVALSTDKASSPVNLYGATKLCSDKLFVAGNSYAGESGTRFAVVRYGNVVGSRGSVIPYWMQLRSTGELPVTDTRMTRFWITLDQGIDLVFRALEDMQGGEIFVPRIPSMRVTDLAKAIAPECKIKVTGMRPGEKLHESMISEDDAPYTLEFPEHFVIKPVICTWNADWSKVKGGKPVPEGFKYASETNTDWLEAGSLTGLLKRYRLNGPELELIDDDQTIGVTSKPLEPTEGI